MPVRLRDVADRAGVSVRTVSNVANGFRHVSPAMRAKVQAAIDDLDYRPNMVARGLRQGRTGTIGLLVPEIDVPYFGELAHQIVEQARELGLTVLIDETGGSVQRELALLDVISRSSQVDGVLLSALGLTGRRLTELRPRVPLVLLGERTASSILDHVGINNVAAAREATQHLVAGGRTRIAAMAEKPNPPAPTSRLRLKGYRAALRNAAIPYRDTLVARVEYYHRSDGARAMGKLLALRDPPDGVFCFNDLMAIGALHELHTQGIHVPDQISVIGFDDVQESQFSVPTLSTVTPDKADIARRALELLNHRITNPTDPPRDIEIAHHLTVRESSAPVRS
jgi:LacI family transcriptional regulator, repressor for deo operon, udp, cdd, tsx, nupC, and nupG